MSAALLTKRQVILPGSLQLSPKRRCKIRHFCLQISGICTCKKHLLLGIVIKMQVHAAIFMGGITFVRSLLLIIPGNSFAEDVQIEVAVIELEVVFGFADFTDKVLGILKCCRCSEQKLAVILVQCIDIVGTAESAVHNQLGLSVSEDIQLTN